MAWWIAGRYFESCSCDAVCPCTWSALTAKATLARCHDPVRLTNVFHPSNTTLTTTAGTAWVAAGR
jgi:hypothetical protein